MSRRSRKQSKHSLSTEAIRALIASELERRFSPPANAMQLPPAPPPPPIGGMDPLMQQMTAQQAPAAQGTPMFSPGAPLPPQPGLAPFGPRQWQFPVGVNVYARPRSTESTGFGTLRNLAGLYDGIQLCEQVWLDTVAKLNLKIKVRDEIIAEQGNTASETKYADKIRKYSDFFSYPDPGNGYDLKTWLRTAVRDQLQIDAVAIYVRRTRGGGVYSLELVDGTSIKPLLDPRGRRPQPPFPAYEQFLYGVPAGLYTSEEMLYQRETTRTESIYGLSRVERIILRVNQALRKENRDLSHYTDGNVPPGLLEPPDDGSQWTPEQLLMYQDMWDALLAGNDQARSRVKVVQPGSKYTALSEEIPTTDFDRFLLNVTASCYSMTMADLGFTENVNKSSGESQENVFYRRAVQPLMDRYAQLFTFILRHYFDEQDLIVSWSGFEESEDFNAMAASYVALTNSGIISPTTAAHQLNLPWSGPEIPNFVMTKDGPMFLEDVAAPAIRKAALDAKMAGFALAKNPPEASAQAANSNEEQQSPPTSGAKQQESSDDDDQEGDQARAAIPEITRAKPAWRPPSKTQNDLEAKLAKAVKDFVSQAKITAQGVEMPDETAQTELLDTIHDLLESAVQQGRQIATGMEQRGLVSAAKNLAGKAVEIVGNIVTKLREKAQEIIADLFGGEVEDPEAALDEAKDQLADWAADYAEVVAVTEIHAAVEESVVDELSVQGETEIYWVTDGDPCQICIDNADASPLRPGEAFPSGDVAPPGHPRCRCTVARG